MNCSVDIVYTHGTEYGSSSSSRAVAAMSSTAASAQGLRLVAGQPMPSRQLGLPRLGIEKKEAGHVPDKGPAYGPA